MNVLQFISWQLFFAAFPEEKGTWCYLKYSDRFLYVVFILIFLIAVVCACGGGVGDSSGGESAVGVGPGIEEGSSGKEGSETVSEEAGQDADKAGDKTGDEAGDSRDEALESVVDFDRQLDNYLPDKNTYHFYFTYKTVHPWWDAVALGIEDAAKQYEKRGVIIYYEYLAPDQASAEDQKNRLLNAEGKGFDVIGVDVADVEKITPVINDLMDHGEKVMTFSSSDASRDDGCRRIAYVGNTHNVQDGMDLTQALCKKLDYKGKVAMLVGTKGAPCHEDRAKGAKKVLADYPDMELVDVRYDDDSEEKAYELAKEILAGHPDLSGIICCNMGNPVGAARAVVEAGKEKEIVIVGMDHDREALHYLRDGVIFCLGVQDCYSIGFDTIQVAVKMADGVQPGDQYPEKTEETTTIIYQQDAETMLQILYGESPEEDGQGDQ